MPSKKRKYEARFPPARIKKIMQTDEEIGKVAAAVPVIISRSLEIFLQSLVETTAKYTNERKAKTMTTAHLKHCIESEKKFDFLKDLVENIADVATQEEEDVGGAGENGEKPKRTRKPRQPAGEKRKKKKQPSSEEEDTDSTSEAEEKASSSSTTKTSTNPTIDITPPQPPLPRDLSYMSGIPTAPPSHMQHLPMTAPMQLPTQNNRPTTSHSIESIMGGSSSSSSSQGKPPAPSMGNFPPPLPQHMSHMPQQHTSDFNSAHPMMTGPGGMNAGLQSLQHGPPPPQMSSSSSLLMNLPSAFNNQQQPSTSSTINTNSVDDDDDYDA